MLELLFNVLMQLAIVTSGTSVDAKTNAQSQADKTTTQAKTTTTTTSPTTTSIGSTGWDDKD